MDALAQFIEHRMQEEDMRPADVARAGGIAPAQLSRYLSGERGGGVQFYQGIAKAFNEPIEKIFRLVGWLPPVQADEELLQDTTEVLQQLDDEHLQDVLDYARMRQRKQRQAEEELEREKKRLRAAIENATPEERFNLMKYASATIQKARGDVAGHNVSVPRILADQPPDWLKDLSD